MDNPISKDLTNHNIGKNYKLIKKVGSGAFGEIYLVQHKQSKDEFAMKLERSDSKHPQLFFEAKLYNYLQGQDTSDRGIPRVYNQGTDGDYNYMVMDCLGKSLEDIFVAQNKKMSVKSVLMLADQMISRIEFIHSKQFLHRDIKPDNFLMGRNKRMSRVYVVDFGLAKRYMTKEGHIPYREGKSLTGTARYASVNTHMGLEQSRRDDLESLGYVLLYLLRGQLPWQNMKATNQKDKYQRIMEKKMQTPSDVLCKGFPGEMSQYLNYCKGLKFEEKPDYGFLRSLIKDAMKKNGYEMDYKYDWTKDSDLISQTQQSTIQTDNEQQMKNTMGNQAKMAMPPKQRVQQQQQSNNNNQQNNGIQKRESGINTLGMQQGQMMQSKKKVPNLSLERKRNSSQKNQQVSAQDFKKQFQLPNQVLAPKIVTTKEPYRKF